MSWSNGTTDPSDQYQQRPPRSGFFESIRGSGWYRAKPRVLGGVCSGISAHQGWDLSLVRVLMVVSAFFMPLVILAYGLAWLLLPEAEDGRIHVEETIEGRFDIAVIGGALMILAALSSMFSDVGVFGIMGIGWFMLIIVALSFSGIAAALVGLSLSRNRNAGQQRPSYGAAHYEAPRNNAPSAAPTPNAAGTSVPFAPATPAADGTGEPDPGMKPEQGPAGFPAYGVPSDFQSSPAGATSPQAGPRPAAATASVPHPGWTPPASAPTPRRWNVPPTPTHRPRTVSGRVNLAITGLLVLITAAVFAGLYWADKGLSIPFITGETADQTIARIITIGGGVCLLVVGLSLAIAALRDRSAGWLTTLSVIGMIMAFPTAAIGTQAARPTDFHINVRPLDHARPDRRTRGHDQDDHGRLAGLEPTHHSDGRGPARADHLSVQHRRPVHQHGRRRLGVRAEQLRGGDRHLPLLGKALPRRHHDPHYRRRGHRHADDRAVP
ncbi:MAG: PspC domain-containing protein [Actinomyces sp.]|nr:PspC domain-containing protein [Actinomyces sp.]